MLSPLPFGLSFANGSQCHFMNRLNLWSVLDRVAVGVDLQMSVGFELFDEPDLTLKTPPKLDLHSAAVRKLLHAVPEMTTLQFIVQAREGDAEHVGAYAELHGDMAALEELGENLLNAKENFLQSKFLQRRRRFLFITTYASKEENSSLWNPSFLRRSPMPPLRLMTVA